MGKLHLLSRPANLKEISDLDDQFVNWQLRAEALQERRWRKIRRLNAVVH